MIIRKYKASDRKDVELIQLSTYFLGKPIQDLVNDTKGLTDDISYYLEKEPQSCFVAVDKGKLVGYLLGCLDDKNNVESIARYFRKSITRLFLLPFMSNKDRKFWWGMIRVIFTALIGLSEESKLKAPSDSGHIHINVMPDARGKGVGTKLLKEFFRYAESKGVRWIHADSFRTRLNPNSSFWLKNGFKEYSKVKTSIWKAYYPNEKIFIICYVKEL